MVDMAVGIIIGPAFGTIVKSLVDDVIMPPIGLVLGGVDFAKLVHLAEGRLTGRALRVPGRCAGNGCRDGQLRCVHERADQLRHRRSGDVLADPGHEPAEAGTRGGACGDDEGMSVLSVDDSRPGHPLCALYV